MKKRTLLRILPLLLVPAALLGAQSRTLDIYWIDVEGGASTLIVSPSGESLLIDTGFETDDRDAKRIFAAAQAAGLKKIDHVVISHYHGDHVGGLAALSKMIPMGRLYGRSDRELEDVNRKWFDTFMTVSAGRRTIPKAGDEIPMKGLRALVVAADARVIDKPVKGGGPNPLCANAEEMAARGPENQNVIGMLLTYGRFTYLNLIDIDWQKEMELACPVNRLGTVTVYQTSRHGAFDGAGAPALLGAIKPQVAVVNNGPRKGLGQTDEGTTITPAGRTPPPYERNGYARLTALPGIEGIWQGHLSLLDKDPKHNTSEAMTANLEETADCKGYWIKASVDPSGRFTVVNARNGFTRNYTAR